MSFRFSGSRIAIPYCVPFGVTVHRYVEGRKWNTQGAPDLSPDFGSIPKYLSSYVVLFVFCFSTGKAMLAINKGLQRSVFFSLLPLRFPLLIFVISSVVWLYSFSHSLTHSHSFSLPSTRYEFDIKMSRNDFVINTLRGNLPFFIIIIWIFFHHFVFRCCHANVCLKV